MGELGEVSLSAMEELLKKVYNMHKEALKGVGATMIKYKTAYEQAEEKKGLLEKSIVDLVTENRRLQIALSAKQDIKELGSEPTKAALEQHELSNSPAKGGNIIQAATVLQESQRSPDKGGNLNHAATASSVDDKDTGEKLKLRSNRTKRSRYSEDLSPEQKKQRRYSPKLDEKPGGKNMEQEKTKVLVPDTCATDLNHTLNPVSIELENENIQVYECGSKFLKGHAKADLEPKDEQNNLLVIPETLAIDNDYSQDVSDDEEQDIDRNKQLSAIEEETEVKSQEKNANTQYKQVSDKEANGLDIKQELDEINEVDSESDTSCDSIIKSSDDEGTIGSQTFSKTSLNKFGMNRLSQNLSTRNACRDMREVNELLETPRSQRGQDETVSSLGSDGKAAAKLYDLSHVRKEKLKANDLTEVILRRSPRKHKTSLSTCVIKSPSNSKSRLSKSKQRIMSLSERTDKLNMNEKKTPNKFEISHQVNIMDETLKSPSILDVNLNGLQTGQNLVTINGPRLSQSSSSTPEMCLSDVESPLLPKHGPNTSNPAPGHFGSVDGEKDTTKNIKNTKSLRSNKEVKCMSRSNSARDYVVNKLEITKDKTKNKKSGNLMQKTLTQGFFSPKKDSTIVDKRAETVQPADDCDIVTINVGQPKEHVFRKPLFRGHKKDRLGTLIKELPTIDLTDGSMENNGPLRDIGNQKDGGEVVEARLNQSVDPAAELSQWCKDPPTLPSLDLDFNEDDLHGTDSEIPRTSTLAADDDTQDIPSSSTSYKFGARKKPARHSYNTENIDPASRGNPDDSFDRLPKKKQGPEVAHIAVVRNRDERKKLQGHRCKQCMEYYKLAGRSDEDMKQHMHQCSRHRAQYVPPDTPPHFWSVGFMDTQEIAENGEKKEELEVEIDPEAPAHRRRKRLNKFFKSKHEKSTLEDDLCFE